MKEVAYALLHWLGKNNIPTEDITITIEFPERRHAETARCCVLRDLEPASFNARDLKTLYGFNVSLRSKQGD